MPKVTSEPCREAYGVLECNKPATYRLVNDHGEGYACGDHVGRVVVAMCEDSDTCVEKL